MKSALNMDVLFGGYYTTKEEDSEHYGLFRLLDFSPDAYHAALFSQKFNQVPTIEQLVGLSPFIGHAPIDSRALLREKDLQLIGGAPLTRDDLEGYGIYLEHHGMTKDEIDSLTANLMTWSSEPPIKLRLEIVDDQISISERE
jgi:hypothetical protein